MSLAAIPTVKYTPHTTNSISPSCARANDTVELSFSLSSTWLHTLSLAIGTTCEGVAYTHPGKCSDLYPTARVCYQESEFSAHARLVNYLLPGSHINFSIGPNYDCQTNIWVIWNPNLHDKNFSSYSCEEPPPQTKCLRPLLKQSETTYLLFNVTEPAYYSHMYSPFPPASCDLTRYYKICGYNTSRLGEVARAVSQEPIQSDLVSIDILYKPYTFGEVCTIFQVKNEHHDCQYSYEGGSLQAEMTRRQDVILFPGLLVCIVLVALLGTIGAHVSCVVRRKRKHDRHNYRQLGSTYM